MDKIIDKFKKQAEKMAKIKRRDQNKKCTICKRPMKENGFSSIPMVCKKCENEKIYKS